MNDDTAIDRDSIKHAYQQVADIIAARIATGHYPSKLPGERDLAGVRRLLQHRAPRNGHPPPTRPHHKHPRTRNLRCVQANRQPDRNHNYLGGQMRRHPAARPTNEQTRKSDLPRRQSAKKGSTAPEPDPAMSIKIGTLQQLDDAMAFRPSAFTCPARTAPPARNAPSTPRAGVLRHTHRSVRHHHRGRRRSMPWSSAGYCDELRSKCGVRTVRTVSMPSLSGWVLRLLGVLRRAAASWPSFYALVVGLGIATMRPLIESAVGTSGFYALVVGLGIATRVARPPSLFLLPANGRQPGFYALVVGLGIGTSPNLMARTSVGEGWFLCPRCRAGYCDGCVLGVAVTCGFGVRFAILAGG